MKIIYDVENNEKNTIDFNDSDFWNLDHTLAHVIFPALQAFKETIVGHPYVSMEDVPDTYRFHNVDPENDLHIFSTGNFSNGEKASEKLKLTSSEISDMFNSRYLYVIDEMIFAFTYCSQGISEAGFDDNLNSRITMGLTLFSKYYRTLWN